MTTAKGKCKSVKRVREEEKPKRDGRESQSSDSRSVISALKKNPNGLKDAGIIEILKWPKERLVETLNPLLEGGVVTLHKQSIGKSKEEVYIYKYTPANKNLTKTLGSDELQLLQIITESHDTGIWSKDLRKRANLTQTVFDRALKILENKDKVKIVKSITAPTRKLYMLKDVEPSTEITGGAWYTDSREFDFLFVEFLRGVVKRYITNEGEGVTIEALSKHIRESEISKVELTESEVKQIADTLVYDGTLDYDEDATGPNSEPVAVYNMAQLSIPSESALTTVGYQCFGSGLDQWLHDGQDDDCSWPDEDEDEEGEDGAREEEGRYG